LTRSSCLRSSNSSIPPATTAASAIRAITGLRRWLPDTSAQSLSLIAGRTFSFLNNMAASQEATEAAENPVFETSHYQICF
jgi:hypothetical protein